MIERAPRPESNFYLLDKKISEDKRLSWAARGLLIYLLGKPDHWQVSPKALANETKGLKRGTGRDGVYAILEELKEAGYLQSAGTRDVSGSFAGTDYLVSETPNVVFHPHTPEPDTAGPGTARPRPANPTQVSIELKQGLKKTEKGLKGESASAAPRTAKAGFPIPDGVQPQAWADWMEIRKAKRAPMTATALTGIEREALKAGVDLNTAVAACCEYGWQSFNAQWYADRTSTSARPVAAMTASNRQAESFAERDARNKREKWERETGKQWPVDELPTGARPARPLAIVIDENNTRRIS